MKSPMIMNSGYIKDKECYSDLQVMQSNAGHYIGTVYTDVDGFQEPGSRDTGYFESHKAAEDYLAYIIRTGDISGLREHP